MSPRREILADPDPPVARDAGGSRLDLGSLEDDRAFEVGIRPKRLADFVGQHLLREKLEIILEAARRRDQPVDHVLFAGPPGLGKTTLAGIMACEMGAGLRITSGPALVRSGDVAAILTDLQRGDVLFIDEIHRMGRAVEELLYPAMEDFQLDIVLGRGPTARSIRLDLPKFTLVGATTRTGLITGPLRDRFGIVARLELYSDAELEEIVRRTGVLFGVELTPAGASEIARRSRGTPRLAIRLLRRVRDFVEVRGEGVITEEAARQRPDGVRSGPARAGQPRPEDPRHPLRPLRRSPRRALDVGSQRRGGTRDGRGRLRTVPLAGRPHHANAARKGRRTECLRASGPSDPGPIIELLVARRSRSPGGGLVRWGPEEGRCSRRPVRCGVRGGLISGGARIGRLR